MSDTGTSALPNRPLLDAGHIADAAGVHRRTVLRSSIAGTFPKPSGRVGKKWLWRREVVVAALGLVSNAVAGGAQ